MRNTLKVLLYAPGTKAGELRMVSILQSLKLPHTNSSIAPQGGLATSAWILLPMKSSAKNEDDFKSDLTSSSLGDKLADALERTRSLIQNSRINTDDAILFLGMDSPEIPMEEVVHGLQISSSDATLLLQRNEDMPGYQVKNNCQEYVSGVTHGKAHLCPAIDGKSIGITGRYRFTRLKC